MADNSELPVDHPMRVAFREYQSTDEYENNRKWAQYSQNVDDSLWSVFIAGMEAQKKLQATPPADAALADDVRELIEYIDRKFMYAVHYKISQADWQKIAAALRARTTVPEGFVMVPVKPTPEMIKAAQEIEWINGSGLTLKWVVAPKIYSAMLSASKEDGK